MNKWISHLLLTCYLTCTAGLSASVAADEMMQADLSEASRAHMLAKQSQEQNDNTQAVETSKKTNSTSTNIDEQQANDISLSQKKEVADKTSDSSQASNNKTLPRVALETSMGKIVLQLYPDKAPKTVANFLAYVDEGFYNGLIFHRVIRSFIIQTGGFDAAMNRKPTTHPNIPNESNNRLSNDRGTIAMARTANPDSANAQFYINIGMNLSLDYRFGKPGYTVFGEVIEGMDVAKKISKVPTAKLGGFADVPETPVLLIKAYRDYRR